MRDDGPPVSDLDRARRLVAAAELAAPSVLASLHSGRGLMLIRSLTGVAREPELLVRLARLFGEPEDYREGRDSPVYLSEQNPEIAVISNRPPSN
eukprot:SAG31_NODE_37950_length_300_cov_0.771144_1_plen_94_part_10